LKIVGCGKLKSRVWKVNYRPYGEKLNNSAASSSNQLGFVGKSYDSGSGLSRYARTAWKTPES